MIIATADNHLGYRQYGLKSREIDIQKSFEAIIDAAINTSSDITISGDLLHSNRPTSQTMAFLKKCHFEMIKFGVTAYVISGNHDKSDPHWVSHFHADIAGFINIDNETVTARPCGTPIKIRGVPFCNKEEWEVIVDDINCNEPIDLLLMHQSFSEFTNFDNPDGFSNESLLKLDPKKCPIIIVGDTHVADTFISGNGILVVSPGSTEVMSMSEDFQKSVFYLKHDDYGKLDAQAIDIPTRPCYAYDIPDRKTLDDVIEAHSADKYKAPIINIKCNYELQSEVSRIKSILSDEAIIRIRGYNPDIEKIQSNLNKGKAAEEILVQMVEKSSKEYVLAKQLINPDCDARFEIDSYIDKRLNGVQNTEIPT